MHFLKIIAALTLLLIQGYSFGQNGKVIKAISHFYLNDSTKIADSMFITLSYYDAEGKLYKTEETFRRKGKKDDHFLAFYKDEGHILEMYDNGRLILKVDYDSIGTAVKQLSVINFGKDTISTTYFPKYKDGILTERKAIERSKNWANETTEYYNYENFPDSSIITATTKNDFITTLEKKCFAKDKKLLFTEHIVQTKDRSFFKSQLFVNKFDSTGKKIEILETENKIPISQEMFYYLNEKLVSSTRQLKNILIKTFYE